MGGDFIVTRFREERHGCIGLGGGSLEFTVSCQGIVGVDIQNLSSVFEIEAHFRNNGIVTNIRAASGGVLLVQKGEIRALFSRPVCGEYKFIAGLSATKMAIEIVKSTGCENKFSLVILLDCKILLNWIESPLQRPWGLAKEFTSVDVLLIGKPHIQFRHIGRSDNILAARLAHDGLSRQNWFKAWW
ncbi:hypothetical protein V6N13_088439 [Hibiscus sabdariffa]|uniref:RNase H type-1 domain-containing protein n=1 Tax=Hibiscus sabdariffa TaxID=183260 RepID=A0ABR2G097_9ROSI